ncbi:MAG TPA: hypothetical protein VMO17_19395 [Terriglobia bacterium]|nr:hypothetical protein [Terriglobia bacterium]
MTLLDAPPSKPPRRIGRYILIALAVIVVGGTGYLAFRNYPEERAISRFLTTVQQGNYQEAYKLWQPSSTYAYGDFLHDWGEQGDYGKIHSFKILGSQAKGSETVVVTVTINEHPPMELVVDRKTKGLAFSPF